MSELFVGLMSGTSQDGVDVAIVAFESDGCVVHHAAMTPYPPELLQRVMTLISETNASVREIGELDIALGCFFADCINDLVKTSGIESERIVAIGHSGHTILHKPAAPDPFTLQLGDPSTIAARTGITTVAHLRQLDIALGGQGAPLAPTFHEYCFTSPDESRVAVNIGGIANVTVLHPDMPLQGFDTGPGNTLLDHWTQTCIGQPFDRDGEWAKTGQIDARLLEILKSDAYFALDPPKSTGLEHFNGAWLQTAIETSGKSHRSEDVQATLTELTASTIADGISTTGADPNRVILCGGGTFNTTLTNRLSTLLPDSSVESSAEHDIAPEWVEAALFAWLARARLRNEPGNAPTVTGARQGAPLGGVYCGVTRH